MKRLAGKQLRLVITLIIVIIFTLSYKFIYLHFVNLSSDYSDKIKLVNAQILQRQDELAQEDKVVADTTEMNSQIEEIIGSFPITLTKEDNLLFIETMEKDLRMDISPIAISEPSAFYTTKLPIRDENGQEIIVSEAPAQTTVDPAQITQAPEQIEVNTEGAAETDTNVATTTNEAGTENTTFDAGTGQQYMAGVQSSIDITFQTTYPKFKKVLEYIKNNKEKASVSNATLSYDSSTGELVAAMTITRYALTGTGKKYEEPYIGDISIGTDNIFGDPKVITKPEIPVKDNTVTAEDTATN